MRDLARRLVVILETNRPLPNEITEWLKQGFNQHLAGADLTTALGLRVRSGYSIDKHVEAYQARDMYLQSIAFFIDGNYWTQSLALSEAIRNFQHHEPIGLPDSCTELLEMATATKIPLPISARQIVRILKHQNYTSVPR